LGPSSYFVNLSAKWTVKKATDLVEPRARHDGDPSGIKQAVSVENIRRDTLALGSLEGERGQVKPWEDVQGALYLVAAHSLHAAESLLQGLQLNRHVRILPLSRGDSQGILRKGYEGCTYIGTLQKR
jgi:hypothetical protein